MSAAHTEGLLAVRDKWIIPADHIGRKIGGHIDRDVDFITYAHIIATVQSKYHDEAANARRLVACWNACDGLSIADLEVAPGYAASIAGFHEQHDLLMEARAEVMRQDKELAAARALLQEVLGIHDAAECHDHQGVFIDEFAERIRAFLKGGVPC